jgi:hypothetical protein
MTDTKMSTLRFLSPLGVDVTPQEWLRAWAELYPSEKYDDEHDRLLAKGCSLSAADFERIGKWKDAAKTEAKWRANVASVAYDIWMQAATTCPKCPNAGGLADFLRDWSERTYTDNFSRRTVKKRFGLSRATTLLYFASSGRLPIFDSRVRKAVRRLRGTSVPNTVAGYLNLYVPLLSELAVSSGAENLRIVDRALFSYGSKTLPFETDRPNRRPRQT